MGLNGAQKGIHEEKVIKNFALFVSTGNLNAPDVAKVMNRPKVRLPSLSPSSLPESK